MKDLYLFCRQVMFWFLYGQPSITANIPEDERQPFNDLLQENATTPGRRLFSIKTPSQSTPALHWFPVVQVFFDTVSKEIRDLYDTKWGKDNISKEERLALKQLGHRKDLVIKEADNGEMYIKETKRQLNNKELYVALLADPTEVFKKKMDILLNKATQLGIITKQERNFMMVDNPIIPTFYMLPKSLQEPHR